MWTTSKLKEEAKRTLKQFGYWMPFFVTFIAGLIAGGSSGVSGYSSSLNITEDNIQSFADSGEIRFFFERIGEALRSFFSNPVVATTTIIAVSIAFLIGLVIAFGWAAFIASPVIVGKNRYFMEHRGFDSKFERLFWAFRRGRYMNIVKTMFIMNLKIFLWSLLFVIPGIVKAYEYSMIPYILAENPQISTERAFELSRQMTSGEKWHIFCLELSFIGWYLLGLLCCCVGGLFVDPYFEATKAELYQVMREKAHGLGFSNYSELPGFFPEQV